MSEDHEDNNSEMWKMREPFYSEVRNMPHKPHVGPSFTIYPSDTVLRKISFFRAHSKALECFYYADH